jgi:hypothetical protein
LADDDALQVSKLWAEPDTSSYAAWLSRADRDHSLTLRYRACPGLIREGGKRNASAASGACGSDLFR